VKVFDFKGKFVREVKLPGLGMAWGFEGERGDPETFYGYTSYTNPPEIYRLDVNTGKSTSFFRPKVGFDSSDYVTKRVFYSSKDGTKVPLFVSHKKGIKLDGSNKTLLYAYGGFNISIEPSFSISKLVWMEMGGVYCVANIRGGAECFR
jgi:prolyl oligopeptidase